MVAPLAEHNSTELTSTPDETTLAASLAAWGVHHIRVPKSDKPAQVLPLESLIVALASHREPTFREGLVLLFLRHPEIAEVVPRIERSLAPMSRTVLRRFYTAAVYLQRLWRGTLRLYLGDFVMLPDYYGQRLFKLPGPDERHGEAGLRMLARYMERETGYNWLSTFNGLIEMLLSQLRLESVDDN
jgi:hypothetical protein